MKQRASLGKGKGTPALDIRDLGQLVASTPPGTFEPGKGPEARRRSARNVSWTWRFAGWMGPMYGPIPIGHLALGLVGLYFKLR